MIFQGRSIRRAHASYTPSTLDGGGTDGERDHRKDPDRLVQGPLERAGPEARWLALLEGPVPHGGDEVQRGRTGEATPERPGPDRLRRSVRAARRARSLQPGDRLPRVVEKPCGPGCFRG